MYIHVQNLNVHVHINWIQYTTNIQNTIYVHVQYLNVHVHYAYSYIEVVCLILLKLNNSRFSKNKLIQLTILRTIQKLSYHQV